jgi:hypothetical protein
MRIMPMVRRMVVSGGVAAALTSGLTACEPTNLYVGSNTVVGVNGSMNTQQTAGHLIVGYDRRFAAIVPKSVPMADSEGEEAMAVLSCSELRVEGIFLTGFTEYLATGQAAKTFAENVAKKDANGQRPLNDRSSAAMTHFFSCAIPHAPNEPAATPPTTTVPQS